MMPCFENTGAARPSPHALKAWVEASQQALCWETVPHVQEDRFKSGGRRLCDAQHTAFSVCL